MVSACTTSKIDEFQSKATENIETSVTQGDFVAVTNQLERLLNQHSVTVAARDSIEYVERQPAYGAKIYNAYQTRLQSFQSDPSASTYKQLTDGFATMRKADLLTARQVRNLSESAQQLMLESIPEMSARSLKFIQVYSFGPAIVAEAEENYEDALIHALDKDFEWASKNKGEYIRRLSGKSSSSNFHQNLSKHIRRFELTFLEKRALATHYPKIFGEIPALAVTDMSIIGPDTAAGVDVRIRFISGAQRTIKYIRFWALPYNSVGDVVRSTIDGESEKVLRVTGPYRTSGMSQGAKWEGVWYNPSLSCFEISQLEVEFMDGSREIYGPEKLSRAVSDPELNDCGYKR